MLNSTKVKVGDKVKVIKNTSSHNYRVGNTYTISYIGENKTSVRLKSAEGKEGNWCKYSDMEIITVSKDFLEKSLKEAQKTVKELAEKIEWMNDTKSVEFNSEQFKMYKALTVVEKPGLTKIEKAKLLVELIYN